MIRRSAALIALAVTLVGCTSTVHAGSQPSSASGATSSTAASSASSSRPSVTRLPAHSSSALPSIPAVSRQARAAGLIDVRTVVPNAIIDLRYATVDNFTHVQLYPSNARCLVHRSMAEGLATAARVLRRSGYVLVFWDCYRPHAVQVRMWQVVPNANWVARPGAYARSHESGRSVDVTLASASTRKQLGMGTGFDDFTPRAYAFTTDGLSSTQVSNRARLRRAMEAGGLSVYSGEWWHFDGPGWDVPRSFLDAPVY